MEDLTKKLLKAILDTYKKEINSNSQIKSILKKINNDKGDYKDAFGYAKELGKCLEKSFKSNISDDVLPDGKLDYYTAKNIIEPMCKENYNKISNRCMTIQTVLNKKSHIGIKGIKPLYKQDKVNGLINYISDAGKYSYREKSFLQALNTYSKSIVDDSVKTNADFHLNSGLNPRIIRRTSGKTCKWCQNLAGVYDYEDVKYNDNGVFRRHANCDCVVIYDPGDGSKKVRDVWTKKWNDKDKYDRIKLTKENELKDKIRKILRMPSSAKVSIPVKKIDTDKLLFDDKHININRQYKITKKEAVNFIDNAIVSINRWNGRFENYYGDLGCVYVDLQNKNIRTAYGKEEFDSKVKMLIEVLKKYEK